MVTFYVILVVILAVIVVLVLAAGIWGLARQKPEPGSPSRPSGPVGPNRTPAGDERDSPWEYDEDKPMDYWDNQFGSGDWNS